MNKRIQLIMVVSMLWLSGGNLFAQSTVTITSADITGDVFWTADTEYLLDGVVYVEDGETLTIEAGTVIRGKAVPTTGDQNTALVVSRGGKIFAEGTAQSPIVFTAESDDLTDAEDLGPTDRGLWGGLIMLGKAVINVGGGEESIEGLPATDTRNLYGGTDDADDSGVIRYVSIRHGGALFGSDNEINGLTMGAIGSGTTIEYVEVFANLDDGYEWFGGTVNTRYLIAAFVGDDNFDYDEGFRGKGQFWFGIHGTDDAGSGGEHDGGTSPETGEPFAMPVVYNATYIGSGSNSLNTSNDFALTIDDNAGGKYYNSIFTEFAGSGITIEDIAGDPIDSRARLEAGDIEFKNNIWFDFGDINGVGVDANGIFAQQFVADAIGADQFVVDPQLRTVVRETGVGLDPRPASGSPALTNDTWPAPRDGFYYKTTHIGAFSDVNTWYDGWAFISQSGIAVSNEENIGSEVPTLVSLDQNYPNPFNPSTNISFSLPQAQQATIRVYDLMGRLVSTLAQDQRFSAGQNVVTFDASNLASGVYIYQLVSGNVQLTRKMTLIK